MTTVNITLSGDIQLRRKLGKLADSVEDWQPAFRKMVTFLEEYQNKVFSRRGAFAGLTKWQKLSDSYAKWKKQNYPESAGKILVLTGNMRSGFVNSNSQFAHRRVTKRVMEYGIDESMVPYAAKHQGGIGVPTRKPLRLTRAARSSLGTIMVRQMRRAIEGKIV